MRLRQALKLDKRMKDREHPRGVPWWWARYPLHTLKAAKRRLRQAWRKRRKVEVREDGKKSLYTTPEYFASNRIDSFVIRQPGVRKHQRERVDV